MLLTIIISLFVVSFVLYVVEVFLIPGFGVCGIFSALCALTGLGVAFVCYGVWVGIGLSVAVVAIAIWLLYWVMHSRRINRLSLHAKIDSTVANDQLSSLATGDSGIALTRLARIGNARINGVECEVRSAKGFIEEGTPIVVTKIHLNEVSVEPIPTGNN